MRVLLTSHGSTGDIYPMIALGLALQNAGHQVRFATSPPFRDEIQAAGLDYAVVPPLWDQAELAYWMGRLQKFSIPLFQLRELYRAALPHVCDLIDAMDPLIAESDVLVSSYLFPMNRALADRHGIPFATFAFAHNTVPSQFYPPDGLPKIRWAPTFAQYLWNRNLWRLGNIAVDTIINQTISRQLKTRGLPQVRNFFSNPAKRVLVGVSSRLMKPPYRLNKRFRFVGYCRWQAPENPDIDEQIQRFSGGEPVPVLTFGSMVYDEPERYMDRFAKAWPKGKKIIIQRGWGNLVPPRERPEMLSLGPVSHDQLFRHASVVIHHGGAGTTASVLHAGKPHIVVPHIADQPFFAAEVQRLGVGRRIRKDRWPELLAETIAIAEGDTPALERATAAREVLLAENGPTNAVAELEAFVGFETPSVMRPSWQKK